MHGIVAEHPSQKGKREPLCAECKHGLLSDESFPSRLSSEVPLANPDLPHIHLALTSTRFCHNYILSVIDFASLQFSL